MVVTKHQPSCQKASPAKDFFLRWLTYLVIIPLMVVSTILCGSLSLFVSLWDKSGRQQHIIARIWARSLLELSFSHLTIIHPERLRHTGGAVFACNHLSYMDTPVVFAHLPFQFRIMANHYLFKYPFAGWHLQRSGQIPIDQSSQRSQIAGMMRGVKTLQSGMNLVLFPDGARAFDGHVHEFMSGAAFMAIKAQVPIVPMALIGTYELLPMHTYHLHPRPLQLVVGEPIDTTGMTTRDAAALTQRLYDTISTMYYERSELIRPTVAPESVANNFDV